MDNAITAYFGGDTSNLKQATDEASIMMKVFGRDASMAVREIGSGMIGAVAILELGRAIKDVTVSEIDAAEKARSLGGAVSDQQQAWLDLHDAVTGTGGGLKEAFGTALSIIPQIGEGIGSMILSMQGIGPAAQKQYTDMNNAAVSTLANISAAHDKYIQEMPAKEAQMNAKIAATDEQIAQQQMSLQEKVNDNVQKQADLRAFMAQQDPSSEAYLKNKVQLEQLVLDSLKLQDEQQKKTAAQDANDSKLQLDVSKQYVQQESQAFDIRKQTQTTEQNIADLKQQIAQWTALSKDYSLSDAQQAVYAAAAQKGILDISKEKSSYEKLISLSVSDQIAMFGYETGAIKGVNGLTKDQYDLLVLQAAQKKLGVDMDQAAVAYKASGSQVDKDNLETLIKKNAELSKQVTLQTKIVANDNADVKALADQVAQVEAKNAEYNKEADALAGGNGLDGGGNPTDGIKGNGIGGNTQHYNDPSQELNYINDSMKNSQFNIGTLIQNLEAQKNQLNQNSFDPTANGTIQALTTRINALQAQYNAISPTNVTGSGVTSQVPTSQTQQQQTLLQSQTDSLSQIKANLDKIVNPPK